jgi:hypothetical protein
VPKSYLASVLPCSCAVVLVYTLHAGVSMMRAHTDALSTLSTLSTLSCAGRLSHAQVDPMHVDTLVNYGSLLKSVHNEMATAEKMYVTALQVFFACLLCAPAC